MESGRADIRSGYYASLAPWGTLETVSGLSHQLPSNYVISGGVLLLSYELSIWWGYYWLIHKGVYLGMYCYCLGMVPAPTLF